MQLYKSLLGWFGWLFHCISQPHLPHKPASCSCRLNPWNNETLFVKMNIKMIWDEWCISETSGTCLSWTLWIKADETKGHTELYEVTKLTKPLVLGFDPASPSCQLNFLLYRGRGGVKLFFDQSWIQHTRQSKCLSSETLFSKSSICHQPIVFCNQCGTFMTPSFTMHHWVCDWDI